MVTEQEVKERLKDVVDPEINIDIVTLGLVYGLEIKEGKVSIKMTFTTPGCPYGPELVDEVKRKVSRLEGVKEVNVDVVFEPPWQPSEELKSMLGIV